MSDKIQGYAQAISALIDAEGATGVDDELFRFGQAVEANNELHSTLSDPYVPAARRQQIVEDLLGGTANPVTVAAVSMVVGAGRGGDLPAIAREVSEQRAGSSGRQIAEVRSAVALTDEQTTALAASLKQATGTDVDIKVIVDPTVLGGVITTIGDTVIDGSVRNRLNQVKAHLG